MNTETKDGVIVKVGQVWRDLDKRMNGRLLRVYHVDPVTGKAHTRSYHQSTGEYGRSATISINRMHRHSTGFALVSEPTPESGIHQP